MIKCMNPECANYKQELDDNIDVCPACGKATQNIEVKGGGLRRAAPGISIASIGAIILTFFMFTFLNFWFPFTFGVIAILTCIVLAVMSRVIGAIITTILSAVAFIGIFAYYGLDILGSIFG